MIPSVLKSFIHSDSALRVYPNALVDPKLYRFGCHWMMACLPGAAQQNTRKLATLSAYSRNCFQQMFDELANYDASHLPEKHRWEGTQSSGTLQFFDSRAVLETALAGSATIMAAGTSLQVLRPQDCVKMCPSLVNTPIFDQKNVITAFSSTDTNGNCYTFTMTMADLIHRKMGVEFFYGTEVHAFNLTDKGGAKSVRSVDTNHGTFVADNVVICAGVGAPSLVQKLGTYLPMYPVKGYIMDLPLAKGRENEQLPFTIYQDSKKVAISPLEGGIRVSGYAEFAGFDNCPMPEDRRKSLLLYAQSQLPEGLVDFSAPKYRHGFRPICADDVPILGQLPSVSNVYLNSGHGSKGWTQSAGCAKLIANAVEGRENKLDMEMFSIERFKYSRFYYEKIMDRLGFKSIGQPLLSSAVTCESQDCSSMSCP